MQEIRDPYRVAVYNGANLGSGNIPLRSMLPDPRLKSVTPNGVISGAIVRICFRRNCLDMFTVHVIVFRVFFCVLCAL